MDVGPEAAHPFLVAFDARKGQEDSMTIVLRCTQFP
jgi:hypothetical protein